MAWVRWSRWSVFAACVLSMMLGEARGESAADTGRKGSEVPVDEEPRETEYHVGTGDVLKVEVYGEPDLSKEYEISPQGRINVPFVGAVDVDNLTPDQVASRLEELWGADYLVNPHVAVRVQSFGSKPVQVLGAVHKPGEYYLTGPTTVLDILAQAGGIIAEKSAREVQIKRQDQEVSNPITVNLDRLMSFGDGNQDLRAGDVVYVPEGLFVYLLGEVNKSGPVVYYDGITVARALTAAGGPTTTARLRRVYVIRSRDRIKINLKHVLQGKDPDFPLKPGDQVYLEESVF